MIARIPRLLVPVMIAPVTRIPRVLDISFVAAGGVTSRPDGCGAHGPVVGTAVPEGIDGKAQSFGPVGMRSRKEVALFPKVVMVRVGMLVRMRMSLVAPAVGIRTLARSVRSSVVARMSLELGRRVPLHGLVFRRSKHSLPIRRTGHILRIGGTLAAAARGHEHGL